VADELDTDALEAALAERFDGTDAERRVVVRQARDLADDGRFEADRGHPLTVAVVIEELADAREGTPADRWNWWLGALDVAYGGYEPFQVRRYPGEGPGSTDGAGSESEPGSGSTDRSGDGPDAGDDGAA
jgi:hypothetical protein